MLPYEPYRFCTDAGNVLSSFGALAQQRGARLVVIPPPMPAEQPFAYKMLDIHKHWTSLPHITVLAAPPRYTFAPSLFFDTYYHLNVNGRKQRTQFIVEDLSRFLSLHD
jgi:hypothetical protein